MVKLLLEFAWRHGWVTPPQIIEHAIWYVYYRGKNGIETIKKNTGVELNGNGFQGKVSNDSG